MAITAPSLRRSAQPLRRDFASRVFGFDVFISFALGPPPRGTQSYASDLARRLRERDFSVFYSEDEMPGGARLTSELEVALFASKSIVVICNRATLGAPRWVRTEVERFRGRHPRRPVIPVNVDQTLQDPALAATAREWLPFDEIVWVDETAAAVADGIASDNVVDRIAAAPRRLRANIAWRWVMGSAFAAAVVAALALAVTAKRAIDNAEHARQELGRATALRLAAESESMIAGSRPEGDERALLQLAAAAALAPQAAVDAALSRQLVARAAMTRVIPAGGPVLAFATSPDGQRLAFAAGDRRVQMVDARTGLAVLPAWTAHDDTVVALAFSLDGHVIASGGLDATVRLWDASSGKPLGEPLRGHSDSVEHLAFSPDGRLLASGSADAEIRLWNVVRRGQEGPALKGHQARVNGLAFAPGGDLLVSVSEDRTLRLWDVGRRRAVAPPRTGHRPESAIKSVAFSPDGRRFVTGGADDTLRLWDARSRRPIGKPMRGHRGTVYAVAYSPDGGTIVSASADGTLWRWDAGNGQPIGPAFEGHAGWVLHGSYTRDGRRIVSAGLDGTIRVWRAGGPAERGHPIGGPALEAGSFAMSADGRRVAVFHDRNLVSIWDSFSEGGPEGRLQGTGLFSSRMAWAPDGRRLFVADENGSVRIWDIAGGQPLAPPARPLAGPLRDLALDPTGTRLALSGESGQIAVAQVNGEKIGPATILGRQKDAIDLGFGTASRFVIVRSYSNPPQVYDLLSRRPARGLSGLQGDDVAAVSPDLRRALLLPRGRDTATLIYAQDGNSIGPTLFVNRTPITGPPSPTDHERMNFRVAFDRAGRYFATAAGDKAIRLWTLDNGESAGPPLQGHEHAVSALSLSDDGQALVSIDRGGHIRAWRGPAAWPAEVCSKLVRNMSIAEWRAWVSPEIKYRCQCPGLPVAADGNQMPEQGRECAP